MIILLYLCFVFCRINIFSQEPLKIKADKIQIDKKNQILKAKGNIKIEKNNYRINTKEVNYDKNKKQITLNEEIKLTDGTKNTIIAKKAELKDNLECGKFFDTEIILNNGMSLFSPNIEKIDENNYNLEKTRYSFCKVKDFDSSLNYKELIKEIDKKQMRIISLTSKKSKIDRKQEKITLSHVFLKFFGVPIFYLPYLSTANFFKDKISGFMTPKFKINKQQGIQITVPIEFYFFDHYRLIISPTLYLKGSFIFNTNLKYEKKDFSFTFNNNFISDVNDSLNNNKNLKLYGNINFKHKVNNNLFYLGNFYYLTGDKVLNKYFNNYSNFLNSNFLLHNRINDKNDFFRIYFLKIKATKIQKNPFLNDQNDIINLNYFFNTNLFNSNNNIFNIDTNIFLFDNKKLIKYHKLNLDLYYNFNNIYLDQILYSVKIKLYNNIYFPINIKNLKKEDKESIFKSIAEFNINLDSPYFINDFTFNIKLQYFYSLNLINKKKNIINEDSRDSELSLNNFFSSNRYSGNDLKEFGNRINYALELQYTNLLSYNLTIAQGYKNELDKENKIKYFNNNFSNILLNFSIIYEKTKLNYLAVINQKNCNFLQQDFSIDQITKYLDFNIIYTYTKPYLFEPEQQKLNFGIFYKFHNNFKLILNIKNDLLIKKIDYTKLSFAFEENCVYFEIFIKNNNFSNKNNWDLKLSLKIKN